jgi:sec-independent protein translocase protein TatA
MTIPILFIGTTELLLIGGLALLLFGGKKLPEMMKGLGQGVQSFKKGMNEPVPEDAEEKDESHVEEEGPEDGRESTGSDNNGQRSE